MDKKDLIEFEQEVAAAFEAKKIRGPIHLNSPAQADHLIEIFKEVKETDWVLSTWRSHWHALLKGVPRETVMREILAGRSMMLHFPEHRFMTSAIVGGMLPIACGLAAGGHKVWCFVGDMCATTGAFQDAHNYAMHKKLPATFVIENNDLSTNTPTLESWGADVLVEPPYYLPTLRYYRYKRTTQHCGTDTYVSF